MVTILTATYNRAHLLPNLFESLKEQTCKDFKWMIVDDGSSDHTEEVIREFAAIADFDIQYIKKENGGKHTAVNVGVKEIDTELTCIIDSDDQALPNTVEIITHYYQKYRDVKNIGMYSFLKCYEGGKSIIESPKDEWVSNHIDCRIRARLAGDMAEVFLTEVLLQYPFREFEGERFLSEDTAWIEIAKKYDAIYINKVICQCEYREDGLSANDKPVKFKSPIGSMYRGKQLMYSRCGLKENVRGAIIYNCYQQEVKGKNIPSFVKPEGIRENLLVLFTKPMGIFYNKKWKESV